MDGQLLLRHPSHHKALLQARLPGMRRILFVEGLSVVPAMLQWARTRISGLACTDTCRCGKRVYLDPATDRNRIYLWDAVNTLLWCGRSH